MPVRILHKLSHPSWLYRCKVVDVHDGDTVFLEADLGFRIKYNFWARLLDCWAKELSEIGGFSARDHLVQLLTPFSEYVLVETIRKDDSAGEVKTFDRFVCVIIKNGDSINQKMIDEGYATKTRTA